MKFARGISLIAQEQLKNTEAKVNDVIIERSNATSARLTSIGATFLFRCLPNPAPGLSV